MRRSQLVLIVLFVSLLAFPMFAAQSSRDKDYLSGKMVTQSVRAGSVSLVVTFDRNGHLQAGDMPQVSRIRDDDGRDLSIISGNQDVIATYSFQAHKQVDAMELGNGLKLSIVKRGRRQYKETLTLAPSKSLSDRLISTDSRVRPYLYNLDAVASQLGLGSDWRETTDGQLDSTGSLITVTSRASGAPLLYLVRVGSDQVAFEPSGKVLFYDLAAEIHGGGDADVAADEFAYLPDHVVLTRDRQIGAYVWSPASSVISSFWSARTGGGAVTYGFRGGIANAPAQPQTNTGAPANTSATASGDVRRRLRSGLTAGSCVLIYDGTTQTCYTDGSGNSLGCDPPIAHYESWCPDSTAGGGGTAPPPTGGSSGSGASNHISDGLMHTAVSNGITSATQKLQSQQCAALLGQLTNDRGNTLAQEMALRGATGAGDFLNNYVNFQDGRGKIDTQNGSTPCSLGKQAWVDPVYSPVINICDGFTNASPKPGMQGVYTIHEMLHTLGYPEGAPPLQSSQDITNMVIQSCGQ